MTQRGNLAEQIDDARAKVQLLERQIGAATCAEIGRHDWQTTGGCNCGCPDGACSVPVHECTRCGDCDYGDNDEAHEIRRACSAVHGEQTPVDRGNQLLREQAEMSQEPSEVTIRKQRDEWR